MSSAKRLIRVGHSPDADDAFMFYGLARHKIDPGPYVFEHQLCDIETLNRQALEGRLELTALSVHAYAYVADRYVLCACGASMGERYGPLLVARQPVSPRELAAAAIAVPGTLTTAYLVLRLCLGNSFQAEIVPFDRIPEAVAAGQYNGRRIDAGLLIHEGQLTYARQGLHPVLDTGQWWHQQTGLPLPLGVNGLRRDLGTETIGQVHRLLLESIRYALDHRDEALAYAMGFSRGLDRADADRFVAMYVNRWTLDLGPEGRTAIAELLSRGHAAGIIPNLVEPQFVGD